MYLESFVKWTWRRVENIKWSDKIRNEEVLRRVGEERAILKTIRKRNESWLGHMLRRDCLHRREMEGKTKTKKKKIKMKKYIYYADRYCTKKKL